MIRTPFSLSSKPIQFYKFLSLHSFLVGLFPVFIPSFLWMRGFYVVDLSIFIVISAIGFIVSLSLWDRLRLKYSLNFIVIVSFLAQVSLMSVIFFAQKSFYFLVLLAIFNGAANCFFWITQRMLFFEIIEPKNSGREFGNFQIFVAVMLNISIVIGVTLFNKFGFNGVYIFSSIIVVGIVINYLFTGNKLIFAQSLIDLKSLGIRELINFRDKYGSVKIFLLDGLFLYLEGYFWIVSLFLIVHEDFLTLGYLVISLAFVLGIIFYLIKNIIDKIKLQFIYIISTILYSISWLLRSVIDVNFSLLSLFLLLVSITFITALFRLSYNKRFFDIAKKTNKHTYLLTKSYLSQACVIPVFLLVVFFASKIDDINLLFDSMYIIAALIAPIYLFYKPVKF